jgi:hypothetical protein
MDGQQHARAAIPFEQMTLRMPRNQRNHPRRAATLPDVIGNKLCPHAQPYRETSSVERAGIANLVCEFERPNEGLLYGVLLVPWPQIAEQLEPPLVEPFVQIQHGGTIEGQRLDRAGWGRAVDGKGLGSRSRNGRRRHVAVGGQLPGSSLDTWQNKARINSSSVQYCSYTELFFSHCDGSLE